MYCIWIFSYKLDLNPETSLNYTTFLRPWLNASLIIIKLTVLILPLPLEDRNCTKTLYLHVVMSWAQCIKLYTVVIYECSQWARVFVWQLFQPSLWVRLRPISEEHLSSTRLLGKLLVLYTNIRLGWKGLTETSTLAY